MRAPKEIAGLEIPGIGSFFPLVSDSMIAVAAALVLFATPISLRERTFALNWEWALKIPWGVPVGTPPNAIVFGTGRVSITQMMRAGFWLNIISIILITFIAYHFLGKLFGV